MIDKDSFTKCNISEIIEVIKGDIIELAINKKVDAIVNAAKPSLMGGNGVDGAIHEKMSKLYNDSNYFNKQIKRELDGEKELADNAVRCKRGEAKITNGLEAGNMGLNDRRDFISMFKKSIEDLNKLGRFDLSLLWTKSMDTYLNLPNANSKYK